MPARGQRLRRLLRSARQVAHELGSQVLIPEARSGWQKRLEERVMRTVLQATRVTNDGSYQAFRTESDRETSRETSREPSREPHAGDETTD